MPHFDAYELHAVTGHDLPTITVAQPGGPPRTFHGSAPALSRKLEAAGITLPPGTLEQALTTWRNAWATARARTTPELYATLTHLCPTPECANALITYATDHGYTIAPNQRAAHCAGKLRDPEHHCPYRPGPACIPTHTLANYNGHGHGHTQHPVLLRRIDHRGWAILSQETVTDGGPIPDGYEPAPYPGTLAHLIEGTTTTRPHRSTP